MNAERLVTIVNTVREELINQTLQADLDKLAGELKQAIDGPNENSQRAVEATLNKLLQKLEQASSNQLRARSIISRPF